MPLRFYVLLLAVLFAVSFPSLKARAHPHIFVISSLELVFEKGKPAELKTSWSFDGAYSALLLEDYDSDADGVFSDPEISLLKKESFDHILADQYYTFLKQGREAIAPALPENFTCTVKKGVVSFAFSVPLHLSSSKGPLRISQYDPQNYTAIFFSEVAPIRFSGEGSDVARASFRENREESYYFGMLHPIEAVVHWEGEPS